jgi:hypothetical protein
MIICPLTKSPHQRGRIGSKMRQDWYVACQEVAEMAATYPEARVLVLSDVQIKGEEHEAEIYRQALLGLGVPEERLIVEYQEHETIGQVYHAIGKAREMNTRVTFVASVVHIPRVWWLTRQAKDVDYVLTDGWARPREFVTDLALVFLFPLIDLCGQRKWFQDQVRNRRKGGRH